MRLFRNVALGAASLALVLSACTPGGGSTPAPTGSVASNLVLAGPPECPERPFCLLGLRETYELEFKEFRPTDPGGPLTVAALKSDEAQVGLLFTSDPAIAVNDFVLLEDDRGLQLADNIIPVLRQDVLDASPGVADALNLVMERLTQDELIALNRAAGVDLKPIPDVAREWITAQGFDTISGVTGPITVGSTNFPEQVVLGEIFAQVLEDNGADVERRFELGNREIVFPALESGEIDVLAEYAATVLEHANDQAGEATDDADETAAALRERLEPLGLTALDPAPATDQNGFVVTRATADRYGLSKLSDLAKPASG